jgi:GT2 family glycosyltransferase
MYTCHLMVVRRSMLNEAGAFRAGYEGAQDYDLMLRLMERTDRIHHLPRILYHWRKIPGSAASVATAKPWALDSGLRAVEDSVRRRGIDAAVEPGSAPGLFRVRHAIRGEPLVSILVPTRGAGQWLERCLTGLRDRTSYRKVEILVAADRPLAPDLQNLAQSLGARVLSFDAPGGFNFSRKIDFVSRHASGEHLLLLNDDVEAIDGEWLTAMLEYSQQPAIGAVGAKLTYPDGRLQHAGILLGVCGVAAHAFHRSPGACAGYASSTVRVGNFSAVSAACMMTRRELFVEAGGFDEMLPVDFNDVDYCLKLRKAGYRVVFTPYARLIHHESASLSRRVPDPAAAALMRQRWQQVLADDPYYNPHLTRDFPDYRLRSE